MGCWEGVQTVVVTLCFPFGVCGLVSYSGDICLSVDKSSNVNQLLQTPPSSDFSHWHSTALAFTLSSLVGSGCLYQAHLELTALPPTSS